MLPSFSLPPLEFCFGTSPIQAEKSRPDRKALGSPTLATRALANAGPTPGISSSRLLVSLDRCQAMISRSNSRIRVFSTRRWAPRATRHARAISGTRLSLESAKTSSSASTPLRPTGATMPISARWARIALITAVCWRMNRWRVRWGDFLGNGLSDILYRDNLTLHPAQIVRNVAELLQDYCIAELADIGIAAALERHGAGVAMCHRLGSPDRGAGIRALHGLARGETVLGPREGQRDVIVHGRHGVRISRSRFNPLLIAEVVTQ